MILKLISIALLSAMIRFEVPEQPQVQIFDVKQERVVKVIPLTPQLQQSVMGLLESSPSMYGGFTMDPKGGIILHVTFSEPVTLKAREYPHPIKEVYLFLERKVKPKALIFFSPNKGNIVVELDGDGERFMESNQLKWSS